MKEDEDIKLTGPAVFWICVFIIVFGVLFERNGTAFKF